MDRRTLRTGLRRRRTRNAVVQPFEDKEITTKTADNEKGGKGRTIQVDIALHNRVSLPADALYHSSYIFRFMNPSRRVCWLFSKAISHDLVVVLSGILVHGRLAVVLRLVQLVRRRILRSPDPRAESDVAVFCDTVVAAGQ